MSGAQMLNKTHTHTRTRTHAHTLKSQCFRYDAQESLARIIALLAQINCISGAKNMKLFRKKQGQTVPQVSWSLRTAEVKLRP